MTDSNRTILKASGLHKSYGTGSAAVHALRGVDFAVQEGEFVAVMGPSGSGKSTLLHVLGLMTPQDEGEISICGQIPDRQSTRTMLRREKIGFVFQRFNLLGVLSAAQNVSISLKVRGVKPDGRGEKLEKLFEQMGVAHVADRRPSQMSIGEQQRVAVVRALAHRPALLMADEPTGNLDSDNAQSLLELFQQMNRDDGQTILMITHSPQAARYADRVVHMKDGKLVE